MNYCGYNGQRISLDIGVGPAEKGNARDVLFGVVFVQALSYWMLYHGTRGGNNLMFNASF